MRTTLAAALLGALLAVGGCKGGSSNTGGGPGDSVPPAMGRDMSTTPNVGDSTDLSRATGKPGVSGDSITGRQRQPDSTAGQPPATRP